MNAIPKDLADLLQNQHRSIWEPKFREYLTKLDKRAARQKPWRVNLLDFLLLCREIKMLQNREASAGKSRSSARSPVHSASAELQNICNERDAHFAKLREVYFDEDSDEKIALSDSELWRKISTFQSRRQCKAWTDDRHGTSRKVTNDVDSDEDVVYDRGDEIYDLVWQAQNDLYVWQRLEQLCNPFLKQASVPALAVLLSIL